MVEEDEDNMTAGSDGETEDEVTTDTCDEAMESNTYVEASRKIDCEEDDEFVKLFDTIMTAG